MELIIIGAGIVIALAGYELLEGIFASGTFNGDDEEIFSPIAIFLYWRLWLVYHILANCL